MVAPVAVREQATQRAHRGDEQDCDDEVNGFSCESEVVRHGVHALALS
jgi:hypothetical protein